MYLTESTRTVATYQTVLNGITRRFVVHIPIFASEPNEHLLQESLLIVL